MFKEIEFLLNKNVQITKKKHIFNFKQCAKRIIIYLT